MLRLNASALCAARELGRSLRSRLIRKCELRNRSLAVTARIRRFRAATVRERCASDAWTALFVRGSVLPGWRSIFIIGGERFAGHGEICAGGLVCDVYRLEAIGAVGGPSGGGYRGGALLLPG